MPVSPVPIPCFGDEINFVVHRADRPDVGYVFYCAGLPILGLFQSAEARWRYGSDSFSMLIDDESERLRLRDWLKAIFPNSRDVEAGSAFFLADIDHATLKLMVE